MCLMGGVGSGWVMGVMGVLVGMGCEGFVEEII
jgi:hypothetical protein